MKPEINTFNQLSELLVQKYERYLPTAFDGSLTILEKMNKIINYLNDVGKLVNGAFEQWNEIMEWVMNEGLNESVINKLDSMIENGEFDTIINQNVLGSRARIVVSNTTPITPDEQTFWFENVGDVPNFNSGSGVMVENATTQDDPPNNDNKLWFDII